MLATTRFFSFLLLASLFLPSVARAVVIEPSVDDLQVAAGTTESTVFVLANNDLQAQTYHLDVVLVSLDEQSGAPSFSNLPTDLSSWVNVGSAIIILDALTASEITLTLTPPVETDPQVLVLGLRAVANGESGGSVAVREGIVGLLFVTIGSGQIISGELVDFSLAERRLTDQSATFYLTMTNTGQTVLKPSGTISIRNIFGQTVEALEINPNQKRLVPGQTRTLSVDWQSKFATGFYEARVDFDAVSGVSGQNQLTVTMVSWRLLLLCLFIFGVVLIVLGRRRKKQA